MIRLLFLLLLLSPPSLACNQLDLFEQMARRLALMPAVAGYKLARNLPIEDLSREQIVLDNSVRQASELGLPAPPVERFMRAQMTAAKAVQRGQQTPAADADLGAIRQQLLTLGRAQLETLACLRDAGWAAGSADRPEFDRALEGSGLTPRELSALFAGTPLRLAAASGPPPGDNRARPAPPRHPGRPCLRPAGAGPVRPTLIAEVAKVACALRAPVQYRPARGRCRRPGRGAILATLDHI